MTFTILAVDRAAGLIGAATASRSLAVGASVLAIRPGVGAVASQAYTNRRLRGIALDALAKDDDPGAAVAAALATDAGAAQRQLALLAVTGRGAAHTGENCSQTAMHLVGDGVVVAGNLLSAPQVVVDMARAFDACAGHGLELPESAPAEAVFSARLFAALRAGEAAGGDRRGRQSAALQVAELHAAPTSPPELLVDLRVDDHADPLGALGELVVTRFLPTTEIAR